jgi:hypothetical protein
MIPASHGWIFEVGGLGFRVEYCDISQLDVVGKLIKGNVVTKVIHDEEDLTP